MINLKIFKAYDVRGIYPTELNEKVVAEISSALAKYFCLKAKSSNLKPVLVVGRDGRLSSPVLYKTVIKNLKPKSYKLKPIAVGMITTPMLYFLVNHLKADGGIMITASHNPKEYNGLKVVGKKAKPINGRQIYELYKSLR